MTRTFPNETNVGRHDTRRADRRLAGIPAAISIEACDLGWQESLTRLTQLVEPEITEQCSVRTGPGGIPLRPPPAMPPAHSPDEDLLMRVLRFPAAVERDPGIDEWLDHHPIEFRSMARAWFERMRTCGNDVRELMHDGAPTACVHDAAFGYVNVFRHHMNVGLFNGAALPDPAGLLEGHGKFMRHVKVRPGAEPSAAALSGLIFAAYHDMKGRL